MALTLQDVTWIRLHAFSRRFPAAARVTVIIPRQNIYAQLALTTYEWGGGVGVFFRSYSYQPAGETLHVSSGDPILNTMYLEHARSVTAELSVYSAWAYAAGTILHLSPPLRRRARAHATKSSAFIAHDARTGRILLTHQFIATTGTELPSAQESESVIRRGIAESQGIAGAHLGIIRCEPGDLLRLATKVHPRRRVLIDDPVALRRLRATPSLPRRRVR